MGREWRPDDQKCGASIRIFTVFCDNLPSPSFFLVPSQGLPPLPWCRGCVVEVLTHVLALVLPGVCCGAHTVGTGAHGRTPTPCSCAVRRGLLLASGCLACTAHTSRCAEPTSPVAGQRSRQRRLQSMLGAKARLQSTPCDTGDPIRKLARRVLLVAQPHPTSLSPVGLAGKFLPLAGLGRSLTPAIG